MIRTWFVLSLSILAPMTYADAIYKTVDEQGNVTYSAEPPPGDGNFEVLDKTPEPGDLEVREAEERQQKLEEYIGNSPEPGTHPVSPRRGPAVRRWWRAGVKERTKKGAAPSGVKIGPYTIRGTVE